MTVVRYRRLAITCFVIGVIAGCAGRPGDTIAVRLPELTDQTWRLIAINGQSGLADRDEFRISLRIAGDSSVVGSSGCNSYRGYVTALSAGEIAFSPLAATRRACEPGLMQLEGEYLQIMGGVTSFVMRLDTLILVDSTRTQELWFIGQANLEEAASSRETMRGYARALQNDLIFNELGTTREFRINDLTGDMRTLHAQLSTQPEESVFFEISVERNNIGSTSATETELTVHDVYRAMPPEMSPQLDLTQDVMFLARGNEPFWAVRIFQETLVVLEPERDSLVLPISNVSLTDSSWLWEASPVDATGLPVRVRVVREGCFDSMSGAYSAFTAEVRIGDRDLSGCAIRGLIAVTSEHKQ